MNRILRFGLAAALLAGIGTGALLLDGGGSDTRAVAGSGETARWHSSRQCRACHEEVWDEWHGSHHQIAFLNPEVRAQSDDFRNRECQACHLPRPVAVTGYGERTLPRSTTPDEGVSCLTCHLGADGRIRGSRTMPDVACEPLRDEGFLSVDMCASCHNQHGTTDQWRASSYAQQGTTCNDCHMPEVGRRLAGGAAGKGRGHGFPGAHDLAMLRRAGRFEVAVDGRELVLALTNVGAGHNFPTEERHRAVDIVYRFVLADGTAGEWSRAYRFRQPYRDEVGENTQLPAGETKSVAVPIPDDAVAAQARLWYRLSPYVGDDHEHSSLLEEREVALR